MYTYSIYTWAYKYILYGYLILRMLLVVTVQRGFLGVRVWVQGIRVSGLECRVLKGSKSKVPM